MGFKRPVSWRRIFLIALVAAGVRLVLGQLVIEPITGIFWPPPKAPGLANEIAGNVKIALFALLLVWTFAAFGEEIAYRGYLLTRAANIGKRSTILMDWDCVCLDFVWLRALLQRCQPV